MKHLEIQHILEMGDFNWKVVLGWLYRLRW